MSTTTASGLLYMGGDDNLDDMNVFDQIDEALEERVGSDRRKVRKDIQGEDRRKGDRRQQPDE